MDNSKGSSNHGGSTKRDDSRVPRVHRGTTGPRSCWPPQAQLRLSIVILNTPSICHRAANLHQAWRVTALLKMPWKGAAVRPQLLLPSRLRATHGLLWPMWLQQH